MTQKLKVGDIISLKGWGCVNIEITRINHRRQEVWGRGLNNQLWDNRSTKHSFEEIVRINNIEVSEGII
jgi:hypothetical protein